MTEAALVTSTALTLLTDPPAILSKLPAPTVIPRFPRFQAPPRLMVTVLFDEPLPMMTLPVVNRLALVTVMVLKSPPPPIVSAPLATVATAPKPPTL